MVRGCNTCCLVPLVLLVSGLSARVVGNCRSAKPVIPQGLHTDLQSTF